MPTQQVRYDLYLDESGSFKETSTDPKELAEAQRDAKKKGFDRPLSSQLAGVLIPRQLSATEYKDVNHRRAKEICDESLTETGLPLVYHATDLRRELGEEHSADTVSKMLETLSERLVKKLKRFRWQPVRLANREQVSYGDDPRYYASMVAELFVRICQQKRIEGHPRVGVAVHIAKRLAGTGRGRKTVPKKEYRKRIDEYRAFISVRRGLAEDSKDWELMSLEIGDARELDRWPELVVSDLISNLSLSGRIARPIRKSFGPYDFSLRLYELSERVEVLRQEGSLGLAVWALAERCVIGKQTKEHAQIASRLLGEILDELARLGERVRDPQLSVVAEYLEQMIEQERDIETGRHLVKWLRQNVESPLRKRLRKAKYAQSLDWFSYTLEFWNLTDCNHSGSLSGARKVIGSMERLESSVSRRLEHAMLIGRGQIARAVHLVDSFEREEASASMRTLVECFDALVDVFGTRIKGDRGEIESDIRAQALGTWLQSQIMLGWANPDRLEEARKLSERAMREFSDPADVARQKQYRCELETAAGDFAAARHYLAESINAPAASHLRIAERIAGMAEEEWIAQGFSLLHWLRLGSECCKAKEAKPERKEFLQAFDDSSVLATAWATGKRDIYPAHGIIRRIGVIDAFRGHTKKAINSLDLLRGMLRESRKKKGGRGENIVFELIHLSAVAEVAALLPAKRTELLDNGSADGPGLLQLVETVLEEAKGTFPGIVDELTRWRAEIRGVLGSPDDTQSRSRLLGLARVISY